MTYNVTLTDGSVERIQAQAVMFHPSGALMFGDNPNSFTTILAHGEWKRCDLSAIQNAN